MTNANTNPEPLVQAQGLRLRYGRKTALDGIDFTQPRAGLWGCWGTTAPARPA